MALCSLSSIALISATIGLAIFAIQSCRRHSAFVQRQTIHKIYEAIFKTFKASNENEPTDVFLKEPNLALQHISQIKPRDAKSILLQPLPSKEDDLLLLNFTYESGEFKTIVPSSLFKYALCSEEPTRTSLIKEMVSKFKKNSLASQDIAPLLPMVLLIQDPALINLFFDACKPEAQKNIYENILKHNVVEWITVCVERKINKSLFAQMPMEDFIFSLFQHCKNNDTIYNVLVLLKNKEAVALSNLSFEYLLPVYNSDKLEKCSVPLLILAMIQKRNAALTSLLLLLEPELLKLDGSVNENDVLLTFSPFFWSIELDNKKLAQVFLDRDPSLKDKKSTFNRVHKSGERYTRSYSPLEFANLRMSGRMTDFLSSLN